jgi:translation initiation factor 3 subunit H
VDEVVNDSNRFNQFQKVTGKNQQQRQTWMAKRRQENEQRRANGQEELPLDEVFLIFCILLANLIFQVNSVHKLPEAPSRIEPMLRSVQMKEYTDAVSDFATKSLGKLFITDAFQKSS